MENKENPSPPRPLPYNPRSSYVVVAVLHCIAPVSFVRRQVVAEEGAMLRPERT